MGALDGGNERLRVGGGNDDGIDAAGDHLLDEVHLLGEVGLVLDTVDDQIVVGGVGGLMGLGAVGHGFEELVGQRLHHERYLRLGGVWGRGFG